MSPRVSTHGAGGGAEPGARPRVLVIDDGETFAQVVGERLDELELVRPDGAARLVDGPAALDWLDSHPDAADLVLLDVHFDVPDDRLLPLEPPASARRTRRFQGVAILRALRARHPDLPVVLLTALEDLSLVDADGRLGAQSMTYFLAGEDLDALRVSVFTALREAAAEDASGALLWGRDPTMTAVRRRLRVLARGRLPVILEGETGTGKSYVAERYVHALSGRDGPFVTLDLAALPAELVPAHLFGATRGAYTGAVADRQGVFELADGGTLFIDEIQNVPLDIQKQLLLVLQDRRVRPLGAAREIPVDVKVIAASNAPLADAVAAGRFRPDLYMRLGPSTRVVLPPLRERARDLDELLRAFVDRAADAPENRELSAVVARAVGLRPGAPVQLVVGRKEAAADDALALVLPRTAWRRLSRHPWPGNVRELAMVAQNLVTFTLVAAVDALASGAALSGPRLQIDAGLVGELLAGSAGLLGVGGTSGARDPEAIPIVVRPRDTLSKVSNEVERQYLVHLFRETDGDFARIAERILGDPERGRAIRLRFNQLGLKVRELRR